jgi:hypothetical protein
MRTEVARAPSALTAVPADYDAGLFAGLLAGLVMSFVMMAQVVFMMGMDAWAGAKMAWTLVAGPEVMRPGFEAVPVFGGMAVHFGLSAVYGLFFAWLGSHVGGGGALLGAVYGFVIYAANIVFTPVAFPAWAGHMAPPNALGHLISAGEHILFGLVLGAAYARRRRGA